MIAGKIHIESFKSYTIELIFLETIICCEILLRVTRAYVKSADFTKN